MVWHKATRNEPFNVLYNKFISNVTLIYFRALCDTNQSGKLTLEQFALAMWMVERKQKGIDPPQVLTASMVPPSMRGIVSGVDITPQVCIQQITHFSNKMIQYKYTVSISKQRNKSQLTPIRNWK